MNVSRAFTAAATVAIAGAAAAALPPGGEGPRVRWADVLRQPDAWYAGAEARAIAANVLRYQRTSGGWPKDLDMTAPPVSAHADATATDSTIDNGATTTQVRLLARVFHRASDRRFADAAVRGIDFLLEAQYANGGWPQFYPLRTDYSRHITFNDNAMVNVLRLLDEAGGGTAPFRFVDPSRRERSAAAVARGLAIILRTQVRVAGRLTAWCAQHDEVTLEPRQGRTYEHVSLSGAESVEIVRFLMSRLRDERVIAPVEAAVAWLRQVRISTEPPQWARFYEIGTNRPIFSGRDGMIRYDLREIEAERRDNYAWLGSWPLTLIEKEYPEWKQRIERHRGAGGPE
jgi:PelA/Pel-15E family pectate lyase